jgi:GntR family transcriptional repressor for pyruvate dehydrogenase complex
MGPEPLGRFFRFAVRGSRQGLAEAVEMRRMLEPPIARLAAERADAAGRARLADALQRMHAAIGHIPPWIEADLDFHEALADAAANRLLALQVRGLRPVIREVMGMFNARLPRASAQWQATYARHARVVEAVLKGRAADAEVAMAAHFEAAEDAIREIFPRDG